MPVILITKTYFNLHPKHLYVIHILILDLMRAYSIPQHRDSKYILKANNESSQKFSIRCTNNNK